MGHHIHEEDPQEKTIRPNWKLPPRLERLAEPPQPGGRRKSASSSSPRKPVVSNENQKKPQAKNLGNKFQLPSRPDLAYKEQPAEDYSDLFGDDDQDVLVFNQILNQKRKVLLILPPLQPLLLVTQLTRSSLMYPNSSTLPTLRVCRAPRNPPRQEV